MMRSGEHQDREGHKANFYLAAVVESHPCGANFTLGANLRTTNLLQRLQVVEA